MNKPLIWWVGLALFVFGTIGAIVPPENYPGWYARAWGITHPYRTNASAAEKKAPAIFGQIWVGRGEKGLGGNTRLEFDQPAFRKEAAAADARVDGRAQHRTWMLFLALIGVLLMLLGLRQEDREYEDRRAVREETPTPLAPANPVPIQRRPHRRRLSSRSNP